MSGIIVGPRAAAQPAADGMAMATQEAMSMQKGRRKMPRRPSGFTIRPTKCTSQRVMAMTAAKPIDEQMAVMSDLFVMLATKAPRAVCGERAKSAITKPATKSTRRVSMRLRSAAIVSRTIKPAIQIVQVML